MQLVINTFGASLRKQGDRFVVRAGEKELAVSAHKVQSILVTTGVLFSSDAVQLASDHNIDVVFLGPTGDPYARVWQTKLGSTAAIWRRQLEMADGPEGLAFVRGWVEAKLRHQIEFLQELQHRRPGTGAEFEPALTTLRQCQASVQAAAGTVRGQVEGTFSAFYPIKKRSRLPGLHRDAVHVIRGPCLKKSRYGAWFAFAVALYSPHLLLLLPQRRNRRGYP